MPSAVYGWNSELRAISRSYIDVGNEVNKFGVLFAKFDGDTEKVRRGK